MRSYSLLISLAYLGLYPYLRLRYREGFHDRVGKPDLEQLEKFESNPIWIHSVSVGEVQAAFPLILQARGSGYGEPLLISTVTCTGKKMAEKLLSGLVDGHFYYPWDVPWVIRRLLDVLRPEAYVSLETEIWPFLLHELKKRNIPSFLVNGRFSDRSFKKACRAVDFWKETLECFSKVLVRSVYDAEKLFRLGVDADRVKVIGDVKIDALLFRKSLIDSKELKKRLKINEADICFVAGSTHEGEEAVVLEAFEMVKGQFPSSRLILVPRHPERSRGVCALACNKFEACLSSEVKPNWDVLIIDEVGVLFDLYSLAAGAFVGGSLVPKGGQNVLEPACFGVPIAFGPHMEDFSLPAVELTRLGVAQVIKDEKDLAGAWLSAIKSDAGLREKAIKYVESLGGASKLAWEEIASYLK